MNQINCPLCHSEPRSHELVYSLPNTPDTENKNIVQCYACNHAFVNPVKPQDYKDVPIEIFDCDLQPDSENRFDFFYTQFMQYYGKTPGRLLEIGCGMGHFLRKAKKEGWQVLGVEPSEKVAKWAREKHNIDIVADYYLNTPEYQDAFDAIVAIECLEHTTDPRKVVERIFRQLKTPGFAYFTVPNFWCKRLREDVTKAQWHEWPAMILCGHLQFFMPGVLLNLCYESGFKVVTTTWQTGSYDDEQLVAACYKL